MPDRFSTTRRRRRGATLGAVLVSGLVLALALTPTAARAAGGSAAGGSVAGGSVARGSTGGGAATGQSGQSLETAATRAGDTGRKVALSLIGLALAVAAIVLAFKRDFKEAIGVLAIGLVAVLLASPTGVTVLQDTVSMLFGGA